MRRPAFLPVLEGKIGWGPWFALLFVQDAAEHKRSPSLPPGLQPFGQALISSAARGVAQVKCPDRFEAIVHGEKLSLCLRQPNALDLAVPGCRPWNIAHHQFVSLNESGRLL